MNRSFSILVLVLMAFTAASFIDKSRGSRPPVLRTVIVDAGHGIMENGRHNGAKGAYSYEDDICLAISKEVVKKFRNDLPEIKIIETRPTEKITAIHRRAEIANENKGDLFICIHVNSTVPIRKSEYLGTKKVTSYSGKGKNRKKKTKEVPQYRYYTVPNPAKGAETYIWGSHKNEDKEVAIRENAPMMQEDNYKENYGEMDVNSPEFIALSLLKTKQFFKRSATLAGFVQDEFARIGRVDRDVRQRAVGIWVLQATAMPSILVETGYISNPDEEDYLNSKKGQMETADCIMQAVKTYMSWLEKQQSKDDRDTGGTIPPRNITSFLTRVEEKERAMHKRSLP